MEILFSHIPSHTTPSDLYRFVQAGIKSWWFPFGRPPILGCEILEVYDEESREYEYHGIVRFDDLKTAERAIKRLNGRFLLDQHVRVREYYRRSPGDRRFISEEDLLPGQPGERRRPLDRRRPVLQVKRQRLSSEESA